MLEDCDLHDVGLEGHRYTWERGRGTEDWIEIQLDRALVSGNFLRTFTELRVINLEISTSDHSPLFLEPVRVNTEFSGKRFKFEMLGLESPCVFKLYKIYGSSTMIKHFKVNWKYAQKCCPNGGRKLLETSEIV